LKFFHYNYKKKNVELVRIPARAVNLPMLADNCWEQ
jgi:hypothetical protein